MEHISTDNGMPTSANRTSGRDAIVRAVYDNVVEHGFGDVTARQLAETAGVSTGLIHHHWPNLDALIVEAFELFATEAAALTNAAVNPRSDPRQQLDDLIDVLLPDTDAPEVALWMEAACQARRQPALAEPVQRTDQALVELFTAIIEQGATLGRWNTTNAADVATTIVAVIDGLAFHSLVLGTTTSEHARSTTRRLAANLLTDAGTS